MLNPDNAKYLKKKLIGGTIDVHPKEKALVVSYEVEATILSEHGAPVLGDKKSCQKKIKVSTLNESSDIKALSQQIVSECKVIHPSKIYEVEQLLYYLQNRENNENSLKYSSPSNTLKKTKAKKSENSFLDDFNSSSIIKETANINDLEKYLEMLYDDLDEKLKSTTLILQLAKNSENLDELCQNETLLEALSRVLLEDWRSSSALATNIIFIFFCFSSFTQLHPVVAHFQIGSLCMKIIEHELNSYDSLKDQSKKTIKKEKSLKAQLEQMTIKQDPLFRVAFYLLMNLAEDLKVEAKMHKKGIVTLLIRCLDRQNHDLLMLIFSFLKKLSIFVENKNLMSEMNIISKFEPILLTSKSPDLLNIILRFMLNLSFDSSLRSKMCSEKLLTQLTSFLHQPDNRLVSTCILYHISMDEELRPRIITTGIIPHLVKIILEADKKSHEVESLALLINLSSRIESLDWLGDSRTISQLVQKAFKLRHNLFAKLLKNICSHPISKTPTVSRLESIESQEGKEEGITSKKNNNSSSLKSHKKQSSVKKKFVNYISRFADEVKNAFSDEFSAQCMGILGNLDDEDIDFKVVLEEYDLAKWIKEQLKVMSRGRKKKKESAAEDLLAYQLVVLIGTSCVDEQSASLICDLGLINNLISLLSAKQEDDIMVLHIVRIFYLLIKHSSTRNLVITKTEAPAYLIDLMHDSNQAVRELCSATLDIVSMQDDMWSRKIQMEKFRCHNMQWIEMIEMQHMQQQQQHFGNHDDDFSPDNLLYAKHFYDNDPRYQNKLDNSLGSHDSFLGGFIEDASALEGADFYFGDHSSRDIYQDYLSSNSYQGLDPDGCYERPSSTTGFSGKDSVLAGSSTYRFDDYDPERIFSGSYLRNSRGGL